MNARQHREYEQRSILRENGWQLAKTDRICWNSGSETLEHFLAKASVGWVLKQDGYRIGSEVTNKEGTAEIDLLAYGTEDPPVAVECETGWTDDVMSEKLEKYVRHEPIRDILPVEVTEMPDVMPIRTWAEEVV